jgi:hypothetical protein
MKKRISKKDWQNLPLDEWNSTTFQTYLAHLTKERFKVDYECRNFAIERRFINNLLTKYGAEVVKEFIDECVKKYRPTAQYPMISFSIMYTYKKENVIPQVQKRLQAKEDAKNDTDNVLSDEELDDWL